MAQYISGLYFTKIIDPDTICFIKVQNVNFNVYYFTSSRNILEILLIFKNGQKGMN